MYRDDALAREIPRGLYVAHLRVTSPAARLEHEEDAQLAPIRVTHFDPVTTGCKHPI